MPKDPRVAKALAWLKKHSSKSVRAGMARYAIPDTHALGVRMGDIQKLAKLLGRDHALALALWDTGVYEARMLCAYVDESDKVTVAQMDRQARAFDNWAVCDTLCFALWVRTPHAYGRIRRWSDHRREFVKRAAYALLACCALKDREAPDEEFVAGLALIERAATDERNFVKKAVNWALRGIGTRNAGLNRAAVALARRLTAHEAAAPRWIGKDALRQLATPATQRHLKSRAQSQSRSRKSTA